MTMLLERAGAALGEEPTNPVVKLTIVEGCGVGQSWELSGPMSSIGRGWKNNVVLDFGDQTVHRDHHAALEIDGRTFRVHDVRRGNPVLVNGEVVDRPREVTLGDRICVGLTTLRLDPV